MTYERGFWMDQRLKVSDDTGTDAEPSPTLYGVWGWSIVYSVQNSPTRPFL